MKKLFLALSKWFMRDHSSSYHPEKHYMRGPGPACHAPKTAKRPNR